MPLRSSSRQPSARETAAGVAVCLGLALTLGWLLRTQAHFSPAVSMAFHSGPAEDATAPARRPDLLATWPASLRPMSAAESFSPASLSDKIDGKAEVYLAAGVAGLRSQRLALAAAAGTWIELFVFDMGTPANAYSVYSSQKRTDVTDLALADYAYRAGNELALVHGPYYVEVVATDEGAATLAAATELAHRFVAATPVSVHADMRADAARFPTDGLIPGSVTLLSADVFGFDQLKDVFVAHYRDGKDELTLFVARRTNSAEARAGAAALRGFFVDDSGGKETAAPAAPPGAVIIDEDGSFDGVFTAGPFLAGVHQAASRAQTERWLLRLHQSLGDQP